MGHEAQVMFNQYVARVFIPRAHQLQVFCLLLFGKRLGKGIIFDIRDKEGQLAYDENHGGQDSGHFFGTSILGLK